MRYDNGIVAAFKMVDTCAAEFEASTPYYYSVFGSENEAVETKDRKKVLVLGSGPIRIGQGIEFDFCSVHCTWAFSKEGYETIIINNNPETVSTDFDIADKLYFEPLTPEDVESIVRLEKPDGAVVQFGGQTAIKLTEALMKMGVPILGTSAENVDAAEDRELFDEILEQCQIPRPKGGTVYTAEEAKEVANRLGYPVLVRPSYVLGGQGMQIAINDEDVEEFIGAGADIVLFPAPGTVPGITMEYVRSLVKEAHSRGVLTMTSIGTSQEGADTETIRQIALMCKMAGTDIHHLGDSGYTGMALPENILVYSKAIRGARHAYRRMAYSVNR